MTRYQYHVFAAVFLLFSAVAHAEKEGTPPPAPIQIGFAGMPRPAVELPDHVSAPQGQVTFWADFAHATDGGVPLYLVNRTESVQSYSSQDHDLYVKLEYKNQAGKWIRAQTHFPSWCGNSYYPAGLPPGHFFMFYGYQPKDGHKQVVRYASAVNTKLYSNEGEGLISEDDVKDAGKDSMAAGKIPPIIRSCIETQGDKLRNVHHSWLKRAAAIRLLKHLERNEVALEHVRNLKRILETLPTSFDVKEAQAAVDEMLAYDWPAEIDPDGLQNHCIQAAVSGASEQQKIGTLASEPSLLWGLLADMFGDNATSRTQAQAEAIKIDFAKMKPVLMAAAKEMVRDSKETVYSAAKVLGNRRIADEVIPTAQFEEWLLLPQIPMERVAAKALARRMKFHRLTELGMQLTPEGQLVVLRALAFGDEEKYQGRTFIRNPGFYDEEKFWTHCMKTQPLEAFVALWSNDFREHRNTFNRLIHDPLRDYLRTEAEKAAKNAAPYDLGSDADKLTMAVRMLESWRMEEDIAVFKLLLKHPGLSGSRTVVKDAAKQALRLRGLSDLNE